MKGILFLFEKCVSIPQLERLVANKLKKKAGLTSAVSDILEGLTLGKIAGIYGHIKEGKSSYWQYPSSVTSEAVAHLFEASGSRGLRAEVMREVF